VIDLATGGGDVPRTILRWAKRRGHNLHVVGLDLHAATAAAAADGERDDRLRIVRGNALDPPFADHSFDYAITSLFLHHLSDDDAVGVLSNMDRLTRRGVIAGDLLRHKRAYAWIKLLTIGANPMVRHDAAVSVRQAFLEPEIESMRRRAGLNYVRLHQHFGHRFILAGEKDGALNPGAPLVDNGL
jgi:ubiquinone/menaquinone biosynthesis C-methylase UbiE